MSRVRRADLPETGWASTALCADMPGRDLRRSRRLRTDREGCLRPLPRHPAMSSLGGIPRGGGRDLGLSHPQRTTTPQLGLRA